MAGKKRSTIPRVLLLQRRTYCERQYAPHAQELLYTDTQKNSRLQCKRPFASHRPTITEPAVQHRVDQPGINHVA